MADFASRIGRALERRWKTRVAGGVGEVKP
jgi:hypothetical protein